MTQIVGSQPGTDAVSGRPDHSQPIGCWTWKSLSYRTGWDILREWGVIPKAARILVIDYAETRIHRQVCYLPFRFGDNPTGMLIASIKADYQTPQMTADEKALIQNALENAEYPIPTPDQVSAARQAFEEWTDPRNIMKRLLTRADEMPWGDDTPVGAPVGADVSEEEVPF
jgi:hypothetical protein